MAYVLRGRKGGTVRFIPLENGVIERKARVTAAPSPPTPWRTGLTSTTM